MLRLFFAPGVKHGTSPDSILLGRDRHPRQQLCLELVRRYHRGKGQHLLAINLHVLRWNVQPSLIP